MHLLIEPDPPGGDEAPLSSIHVRFHGPGSLRPKMTRSYLRDKVLQRRRIPQERLLRLYCDARLAFGLRVPIAMRWTYAQHAYDAAVAQYVSQVFPGRVVLVKGKEYPTDGMDAWVRIAAGGLVQHEMSSSNHLDFVTNEQSISQWAELLRRHLQSPAESC